MSQNNKIAIVTGAGSGIGRAVAIALCKDGWSVVLAGRREKQLIETANACDVKRTLVVPTDITIPESVQHLFSQTIKTFGRLDLLFNNAGVNAPAKPFEELTLEEWQRVIDYQFDRSLFVYPGGIQNYETSRSHGWTYHQ